jgi:hypothetical protein
MFLISNVAHSLHYPILRHHSVIRDEDRNQLTTIWENMMKKNALLTTTIAALFMLVVGVNSGFAKKSGESTGQDSTHHDDIASGSDFGDHVSDHAKSQDGFSGDMNPGNHKGSSTLKD